jgi:hypothetical protein
MRTKDTSEHFLQLLHKLPKEDPSERLMQRAQATSQIRKDDEIPSEPKEVLADRHVKNSSRSSRNLPGMN